MLAAASRHVNPCAGGPISCAKDNAARVGLVKFWVVHNGNTLPIRHLRALEGNGNGVAYLVAHSGGDLRFRGFRSSQFVNEVSERTGTGAIGYVHRYGARLPRQRKVYGVRRS